VLALCLAAPRLALAAGEQVGRISGTVTEAATQAPVPGANVSVSGPALIGPARTTVTHDDGTYQITNLEVDVSIPFSSTTYETSFPCQHSIRHSK
jgi:hypothetical protein